MATAAPEKLSPQVFEGKGFSYIASLISAIAVEKQQGKMVGLGRKDGLPKTVVEGSSGRLARALLGENEVFHGDPLNALREAVERSGAVIGFAPEGSLDTDVRVQKATGVSAAALAVGNQMGKLEDVYAAYQKGYERGKKQKAIEANFVLPHILKKETIDTALTAQTPEQLVKGTDVRFIFFTQLVRGKENDVTLTTLAKRTRSVYINLALQPETKAAAAKVVVGLFATKEGKEVPYDAEIGLGSPGQMMQAWDKEVEAYKAGTIEEWVSKPMLFEKTLRAIQASGVYKNTSLSDLRTGWAGKAVGDSLKFLKRRSENGDVFYSPYRIIRRLSGEARRRIESGRVSDVTLGQALIGALERLYSPGELVDYQRRLNKDKDKPIMFSSLKTALSLKLLETRSAAREVTDAIGVRTDESSEDFRTRINTYNMTHLESSISWRTERVAQVEREKGDTKVLNKQLEVLQARRANLLRLMSKDDLGAIEVSINDRISINKRLGDTPEDQAKRKAYEVEISVLKQARERRVLYFQAKAYRLLVDSQVSRETELEVAKLGLEDEDIRRIQAELRVILERRAELDRLENKTNARDIQQSIEWRQKVIARLGISDMDLMRRRKLQVELDQLALAPVRKV